jgi:hypothetical protein
MIGITDNWNEISLHCPILDLLSLSATSKLLNKTTRHIVDTRRKQFKEIYEVIRDDICSRGAIRSELWFEYWITLIRDGQLITRLVSINHYISKFIDLSNIQYELPEHLRKYCFETTSQWKMLYY